MKYTKSEVAEARETLLKFVAPGDTIFCTLKHVSRSGMMREIGFYTINADKSVAWLSGLMGKVLGLSRGERDGLKVQGCGMDMGFHVVYNLGRVLWPEGVACTGEQCFSNDHANGDRDHTAGRLHRDSGYALRSTWL